MRAWRLTKSPDARAVAERPLPRRGMVGWFDPGKLVATGIDVVISTALGRRADYRLMESVGLGEPPFSYRAWQGTDFYWDYLADTGDGWNSTHAIASLVAQPELSVDGEVLPRGRFLLLGGDEVYPVASRIGYAERLVAPFETAFPKTESLHGAAPYPNLYAIPGNHDWYDGLVSFSRRFTQGRWIGGWKTRQTRSYFAIELPSRWWLWGVDIQLESDIDLGQRDYFAEVAQQLQWGDRVILASAEPDWIYGDIKDPIRESNLAFLEEMLIAPRGATVHVWLAGDLHHYRRHEHVDDPNFQRITSGGGGAYLASTHQAAFGPSTNVARRTVEVGRDRFEQRAAYPGPATSWRLSLLNIFFLIRNWKFGLVTGLAYATLTWLRPAPPLGYREFFSDPVRAIWAGAVLLLASFFAFYSGKDGPLFRLVGGVTHAVIHIAAALAVASWTAKLFGDFAGAAFGRFALNFLGGAIVGPILLGLFLMIGANLFGAYTDEAFSALRIQDFKHFLRFRIRPGGALDIYAIGIDRVPRAADARARYRLIDGPIRITPSPPGP